MTGTAYNAVDQIGVAVQDEGVFLGTGTVFNFLGNGVTASISGTNVSVVVTGSFPNPFALPNDNAYTLTGTPYNNYNPTNFSTTDIFRLSTLGTDVNVSGLISGTDGRIVTLKNVGVTGSVILQNDNANSSTVNRFYLGANTVIPPQGSVSLQYDITDSRWRLFNSNSSASIQGVPIRENAMSAATATGKVPVYSTDSNMFEVNFVDHTNLTSAGTYTHISVDNFLNGGWVPDTSTWTYTSADAPTYVISINSDMTSKLQPGTRIKLTHSSAVKYFIVTVVGAYSGGATSVTLYGGVNYTLSNSAISSTYFSSVKAPIGFSLDPADWTVSTTDTTNAHVAGPTNNTYYNPSSLTIVLPIGKWRVFYNWTASLQVTTTALRTLGLVSALSTSNNSVSDNELRMSQQVMGPTGACTIILIAAREKQLTMAAKTTYYLIVLGSVATDAITDVGIRGDLNTTVVKAVCAYL